MSEHLSRKILLNPWHWVIWLTNGCGPKYNSEYLFNGTGEQLGLVRTEIKHLLCGMFTIRKDIETTNLFQDQCISLIIQAFRDVLLTLKTSQPPTLRGGSRSEAIDKNVEWIKHSRLNVYINHAEVQIGYLLNDHLKHRFKSAESVLWRAECLPRVDMPPLHRRIFDTLHLNFQNQTIKDLDEETALPSKRMRQEGRDAEASPPSFQAGSCEARPASPNRPRNRDRSGKDRRPRGPRNQGGPQNDRTAADGKAASQGTTPPAKEEFKTKMMEFLEMI